MVKQNDARGHPPLDKSHDPKYGQRKQSGTVASRRSGPKGETHPHGD